MLIRKLDCDNTVFRAELMTNAKIPAKRRFKAVADQFKQQTKNFPDRKFYISQHPEGFVSLQLVPKNKVSLVDGVYTSSLKEQFKQMSDEEIGKFYYSSFKLMTLSEKYHELQNQIKEIKEKLEHNLNLAKKFRENSSTMDFAARYEAFSQIIAKKLEALNQESCNVQNVFKSYKERSCSKFPELSELSL